MLTDRKYCKMTVIRHPNTQTLVGKNAIINGNFDFWQRGTSFTNPSSTSTSYSADRWNSYRAGFATGITTTQQNPGLTGFQYNVRVQRNSGDTSTAVLTLQQSLETRTSLPFAGQTVVVSFYARAGANFSSTSNLLNATLTTGTGTDQSNVGGYTGSATPINTSVTLTTSWQRFSVSGTLATNTNEISFGFNATPTGTAGANDYFEVTGVQLELGFVATSFSRAGGTIQGELAACQRYYWRSNGGLYGRQGVGIASSTTSASILVNLPITMRIIPTTIEFSSLLLYDTVTATAVSAASLVSSDQSLNAISVTCTVASGLTQYRPYLLANFGNASGYLGVLAEL